MQMPLKISFHGLQYSDALASDIRKKVSQLERFCPQLISVKVTVGRTQERHRQGNLFMVRVILTVPRQVMVVNRNPGLDHAHEDPFVAVRDAFWAARRQLMSYLKMNFRIQRQFHAKPPHGIVERILLDRSGGFIRSEDGQDIYFHKNSVLKPGFERIRPGQEVRFSAEMGENGPQATSVETLGRWGKHGLMSLP